LTGKGRWWACKGGGKGETGLGHQSVSHIRRNRTVKEAQQAEKNWRQCQTKVDGEDMRSREIRRKKERQVSTGKKRGGV